MQFWRGTTPRMGRFMVRTHSPRCRLRHADITCLLRSSLPALHADRVHGLREGHVLSPPNSQSPSLQADRALRRRAVISILGARSPL
mgnify:CR=1 FL=1